jgi:protein-S-isoprenylcysteine O-methyltransferase Ste14
LYFFHGVFFGAFALRLLAPPRASQAPSAEGEATRAPGSRGLVFLHAMGFGVMYFGIGQAVFTPRPLALVFPQQRALGAIVILLAAMLVAWTMLVFRSWRLLARIEAGHELCTSGPFAHVRHPIYLATDLLALGSLLWLPTPIVLAGVLFSAVGADLRARSEEAVLMRAFGGAYRDYAGRVKRFVPGLY